MEAFLWYLKREGTVMRRTQATALLDARLKKPAFRGDMEALLRPGLAKFDVDAAAVAVRAAYLDHLPV